MKVAYLLWILFWPLIQWWCAQRIYFLFQHSKVIRIVIRQWHSISQRKGLHLQLQSPTPHLCTLSQLQDCWPCRKVEDFEASLQKLLVAPDVKIHWQICLHLWHVPAHQSQLTVPSQRTASAPYPWCSVGHHQCRLYSQTTRVWRKRCCHGSSWLCYSMWPLCRHGHYTLCCRNGQVTCPAHLEAPWPTKEGGLWQRSAICGGVHGGTLLAPRDTVGPRGPESHTLV